MEMDAQSLNSLRNKCGRRGIDRGNPRVRWEYRLHRGYSLRCILYCHLTGGFPLTNTKTSTFVPILIVSECFVVSFLPLDAKKYLLKDLAKLRNKWHLVVSSLVVQPLMGSKTQPNPIVKANQKGRICHTPLSHWLICLGWVGLGLSLHCKLRLVLKLSRTCVIPIVFFGAGGSRLIWNGHTE